MNLSTMFFVAGENEDYVKLYDLSSLGLDDKDPTNGTSGATTGNFFFFFFFFLRDFIFKKTLFEKLQY